MTQDRSPTDENANAPARSLELELLLSCATIRVDSVRATRIRTLLEHDIDWTHLLRSATRHQVTPLIGANLCAMFADACPAHVLDEFRTCLREITARNMYLARELIRLLELFESHSIPVIPFKGPLLASYAYGHLGLRAFCDLDVLVDGVWDYRVRVPELLRANGWTLVADGGYECTFTDANGELQLDVHQALTPQRGMPYQVGFQRDLEPLHDGSLHGHDGEGTCDFGSADRSLRPACEGHGR